MPNTNQPVAVLNPQASVVPMADSRSYFTNLSRALSTMPHTKVEQVAEKLHYAYEEGRKVLVFGNGGSASLASISQQTCARERRCPGIRTSDSR